jgi:Tol biopolymer transport system component
VLDLVRGTFSPLTTPQGTASPLLWSQDDRRLWFIYAGPDPTRPELYVVPTDGSGSAAAVSGLQPFGQSTSLAVPLLGPDGPLAIVGRDAGSSGTEIFSIPLEEDSKGGKPRPLFGMRVRPSGLEMSSDRRLLAYQSNETGRNEVWVTPFPGPGPRVLVSTDGGEAPRWNPKGHELFYRNGSRFMTVEIQTVPVLRAGSPKVLFDSPDTGPMVGVQRVSYDVSPDGQRFLLIKPQTTTAQSTDVRVIVNWADELARKAPLLK